MEEGLVVVVGAVVGPAPADLPGPVVAPEELLEALLVPFGLAGAELELDLEQVAVGRTGFDSDCFVPGQPYLSLVSIPLTLA